MFANRLQSYFTPSNTIIAAPPANWPDVSQDVPWSPVAIKDIYQAAYDRARQDYEISRLFNPEFYGDGSGI